LTRQQNRRIHRVIKTQEKGRNPTSTITTNELYENDSQPVADRVEDLVSRMTLAEKVAQLGSCYGPVSLGRRGLDAEKAAANIGYDLAGTISKTGELKS